MSVSSVTGHRLLNATFRRRRWAWQAVAWAAGATALGLVLGLAAGKLPSGAIIGLVVAVPAVLLVSRRPEFGLLGMVAVTTGIVDSDRLPLLGLGPVSLHLTDLMLVFLLGLVAAPILLGRGAREGGTPLDLPVVWFLAAAGLSAGMAVLVFGVDPTFVLRLMRPLAYYASFFAVTRLLWERRQVQTLLNGLLWLGALASAAVILQTAFPQLTILRASSTELVTAAREYSGVHRVYTHADRLIYPMLLLSVTFLALRVTPTSMEAGRAALLAVALILSFQRNYWGTSLLMVGLLTALVPAWARLRLAFALGAAAVLIMVSALIPSPELMRYRQAALERFVYGLSPETVAADGSAQDRVLEIAYGLQTVVERPVLGIGLGNLYRPLNANDLANREMPPAIGLRWYIHNAYLWVWVDMGLVGLIPFLWLYGAGIYRGLRSWRAMPDRRTRAVVLGLSLGLMGQAGSNLVAPNFIQSWSLLVFPVLLGLNEVILRAATQQTHMASEMVEG